MGEKVLRARFAEAGLADAVRVSSVGIGPWHVGEGMDRRAAATLSGGGYDTDHRARQVDDADLDADLLLAATTDHADDLRAAGADPGRVRLLRSFDPDADDDAEVPDPYFGGPDGFDEVLAMIEAAAPGVVDWARART